MKYHLIKFLVFLSCIGSDYTFESISDNDICGALETIVENDDRFACNLGKDFYISNEIPAKIRGKESIHKLKNLTCFNTCNKAIPTDDLKSKRYSDINLRVDISINDNWDKKNKNSFAVFVTTFNNTQYLNINDDIQFTTVYLIKKNGRSYSLLSKEVLD